MCGTYFYYDSSKITLMTRNPIFSAIVKGDRDLIMAGLIDGVHRMCLGLATSLIVLSPDKRHYLCFAVLAVLQ